MSKIKDLRNTPEYNINLVDVFKLFTPKDKTKYIELMLSLIKKTIDFEKESTSIKNRLMATYKIEPEEFVDVKPVELVLMNRVILSMFDEDLLVKFKKFCDYNERGLIQKNDLTSYSGFDEMSSEVEIADLKETERLLESQVLKLYDDKEWLVIKPLTYVSSNKYGSGTKWCTAGREQSYFRDYAKRGILIYCINRKTNYKVACFRSINETDVSFWNMVDTRIDSLQTELPDVILTVIKNEVLNNLVTNESLIPNEYKKEKLLKSFKVPGLGRTVGIRDQISQLIEKQEERPMSIEEGERREQADRDERFRARNYVPTEVINQRSVKIEMSGTYGGLDESHNKISDIENETIGKSIS